MTPTSMKSSFSPSPPLSMSSKHELILDGNLPKYESKSNLESNEHIWKPKSRDDGLYSFPHINIG